MSFFTDYGGIDLSSLPIPIWLDLIAVLVGSFAGVLAAQERKLDLIGHVGLALICGLGGGLIRDTILQAGTVYMMQSIYAIPAATVTGVVGFFFPSIVSKFPQLYEWVDIFSVSLFVALGTEKAMLYEAHMSAAILLGTITGIGGGMLRDVFLGEVPHIFQRSNLYAICSVAGAVCYYVLVYFFSVRKVWALVLCIVVVVGLRRWSLRFNVLSPESVDLSPRIKSAAHTAYKIAEDEGRMRARRIIKQGKKDDRK